MKWLEDLVKWVKKLLGQDEKPTGPKDEIDISNVKWCKGLHPKKLSIEYDIIGARRGGMGVQWDGPIPSHYQGVSAGCNGAVGFIREKNGKLVGAWGEQTKPGLNAQTLSMFKSRKGLTFHNPLENSVYEEDAEYYILTADGKAAFSSIIQNGRSNVVKLIK